MAHLDLPTSSDRAHAAPTRSASENSVFQMIWRQYRMIGLCAAAFFVLALLYVLVAPPVYTATARLLVQRIEPVVMTPQHTAEDSSNAANDNFLSTQCELIRATPILAAVVGLPETENMKSFDGVSNRMLYLKKYLATDVGKKDDIITVSFPSRYKDEAIKIVDATVDAYEKYCGSKKRETANEVLAILQSQKEKSVGELASINAKIIQLKRDSNTISFGPDKTNYALTRLSSLSDALTTAHMDTINARSALESAARTIGSDADSIPANLGSGVALSPKDEELMRAELVALTQQLQERKRIYLPDHPIVRSLQARINQLNMAYVGAAKVRYEQAKTREVELSKSYETEQLAAINVSSKATEAAQMEADAKRVQEVINGLEARIKDVSIVVDAGALNITVLESAAWEDNGVKPGKVQVPMIALVLGILIGCGVAIGRELADPKLHSTDDIKALVTLPVLGMVPRQTPASSPSMLGQIVEFDPHSEVAEAMRAVRTSLTFGVAPENARSLLVTSPEPGDGKTTVATNLAIALANAGKRVLIIDGDLRSPSVHQIFGISNDDGFSGLLSRNDNDLQRVMLRTGVARLSVIAGGPPPMSPSEMLNDPAFGQTLAKLYQQFDHVVIDSPPIMRVDDARIMAAMCDCTILVTRAEKTSHSMLRSSVDRLTDVGAYMAGVVLNASRNLHRYGRYGTLAEARLIRKPESISNIGVLSTEKVISTESSNTFRA